jgi:hypothetical protein
MADLMLEDSPLRRDADVAGSGVHGFGYTHPGLKEGEDEERFPEPVTLLSGGRKAGHLLPGEVGERCSGPGGPGSWGMGVRPVIGKNGQK